MLMTTVATPIAIPTALSTKSMIAPYFFMIRLQCSQELGQNLLKRDNGNYNRQDSNQTDLEDIAYSLIKHAFLALESTSRYLN
jgi:hypothetical protein